MGIGYLARENVNIARLCKIIKCPRSQGLLGRRHRPVTGKHDHGEVRGELLDLPQGLVTVNAGHLDVEYHHVRFVFDLVDGLLTTCGNDRIESSFVQNLLGCCAELLLVINHQYFYLVCHFLYLHLLERGYY